MFSKKKQIPYSEVCISEKWVDISSTSSAPISGLYLIECLGDNHTFYEVCELMKGELIISRFTNEKVHLSGWSVVKPKRYFFIPYPQVEK